jgi:hypothetical protein
VSQGLRIIDHPLITQNIRYELIKDPRLPAEVRFQYPPGLPRVACRLEHSACRAGHAVLPQPPYQHIGCKTMMEPFNMRLPCLPEPREVLHST